MQSKDLLLMANRQCATLVLPLLEDLKSAPLVSPVAKGGNHAHWIAGHLLVSEAQFRSLMDGSPNSRESLKPLFGGGSQPVASGEGYPPYEELLGELKSSHQKTLAWLEGLSEADLDQRSKGVQPKFEDFFGTWRQVLLVRAMHWMNHRGQLADCRRAAGRAPLMM